jgi:hypothetical protein
MRALLLVSFLAGGCRTEPTVASLTPICNRLCERLTSCSREDLASCTARFRCAEWTDPSYAACEEACFAKAACSQEEIRCRSECGLVDGASCAAACGACGAGEVCYGGAIPNSPSIAISARCLKSCSVSSDCPGGLYCVQDVSGYGRAGAVCMAGPGGVPTLERCTPFLIGTCTGPELCVDDSTLNRPFFTPLVCGREIVRCDRGCEGPPADGGVRCR